MNLLTIYSIPPILTLVCFLGLAGLTLFRGKKSRVNFLFLVICTQGIFLYGDILFAFTTTSAHAALLVSRIDHAFLVFLIPAYIHFFHLYLRITARKKLVFITYGYAFVLLFFTQTPLYIESMEKQPFGYFAKGGPLYPFFGVGGLLVTFYVLYLLHRAILSENNGAQKNRLKYVLAGFGLMGLLNGLNVFPMLGVSMYPPGNWSFLPLILFAIGIFKHNLLDMGLLVKKSLMYSSLTALFTLFYALIILLADALFKNHNLSGSYIFSIFFFLLIAFVIGPLKGGIQSVLDRLFFKGKYNYQKTIKEVSRTIVSVLDSEEIANLIVNTLNKTLRPESCRLFLDDPNQERYVAVSARPDTDDLKLPIPVGRKSPLAVFMRKRCNTLLRTDMFQKESDTRRSGIIADLEMLKAEIVLPMVFKEHLNGFITLGRKLSGDLYTKEDIDLLETLSDQSALAVQNSGTYRLVQNLNRSLEEKVEKRTRALKETLLEKERTQQKLIQSESLAAIGQLVAGVAHELNNPLASVKGLVQAAIEDLDYMETESQLQGELIDDLRFADKELKRAGDIVASLLGLSRQTQTYSEAVGINSVIQDALRILRNQVQRNRIDVIETYAQELPAVSGNFANLGQVALNIIQNAIQAIGEEKGTIHLKTFLEEKGNRVVFTCEDSGTGIPDSIRRDIFKPFFTTKETGKGTGLGLYICHEIVDRHGGDLTVKESLKQGSCFRVRLPASS